MFHNGLSNALRQILSAKGAAPEDLMTNALFQVRWNEVVKSRNDELISLKLMNKNAESMNEDNEESAEAAQRQDLTHLRGGKALEKCAPHTSDYWDSFAAQILRQYLKLTVEPSSATGVSNEVKNSSLNDSFVGESNKSSVAVVLDADLLQETAYRPGDRKPPPNQAVISKLLQGTLAARRGASNEEGLRVAPGDNDIFLLCDSGRDTFKSALQLP